MPPIFVFPTFSCAQKKLFQKHSKNKILASLKVFFPKKTSNLATGLQARIFLYKGICFGLSWKKIFNRLDRLAILYSSIYKFGASPGPYN